MGGIIGELAIDLVENRHGSTCPFLSTSLSQLHPIGSVDQFTFSQRMSTVHSFLHWVGHVDIGKSIFSFAGFGPRLSFQRSRASPSLGDLACEVRSYLGA